MTSSSDTCSKSPYHRPTPSNRAGRPQADDLVGLREQLLRGVGRAHRHREDDLPRTPLAHGPQRGRVRHAGGHPVVDHDHGAPGEVDERAAAAVAGHAAPQLGSPRAR